MEIYKRLFFSQEVGNISNCEFMGCISNNLHGGAIYSIFGIIIKNCLFRWNSSPKGGAIYCKGTCNIDMCSFSECSSDFGGGIVSTNSSRLKIIRNSFYGMNSYDCSCIYGENSVFSISNISFCGSENNYGVIYHKYSDITVDNSIFFEITSKFNPGISIYNTRTAKIERCFFLMLHQSNSRLDSGLILLFDSQNTFCTFDYCVIRIMSLTNVPAFFATEMSSVLVNGLCSSYTESVLIRNTKNIVFSKNCNFGTHTQCPLPMQSFRNVGYMHNIVEMKKKNHLKEAFFGVVISFSIVMYAFSGVGYTFILMKQFN